MHRIPVDEASQQLEELIRAVLGGEEVILTKDSLPVVKLVDISQVATKRQFGSARGMIEIRPGFDAPIDDIRDYTE